MFKKKNLKMDKVKEDIKIAEFGRKAVLYASAGLAINTLLSKVKNQAPTLINRLTEIASTFNKK